MEKRFPFRAGRSEVSFYLEIQNLFRQKDDSSFNTTDWSNWGLQTARPDNSDYVAYGDLNDRSFYADPRRWELGFRAQF